MDSPGAGPEVHHPKWRRTPAPQPVAPAKPTTAREYQLWLKEQTLQLLELILYGDELVEAGMMTKDEQGRNALVRSSRDLINVLNLHCVDISNFPKVGGVHGKMES